MIYKVLLDDVNIYDVVDGRQLLSCQADLELNGGGSCDIVMPYNHESYDRPQPMQSEIIIEENDEVIWFGRVTDISINWNNEKKISAEGALAYFNDSILRPQVWSEVYLSEFFEDIIELHNDQVSAEKQFEIGYIDPLFENMQVTRTVEYTKTFDVLQEQCIKAVGGYIFLRKEKNQNDESYTQYIDWYKEIPYQSSQSIRFAVNLLDVTSNFVSTDIITAVIPLGDDGNGHKVPITDYAGEIEEGYSLYRDYLQNDDAVDMYGLITEVIEFNDVADKGMLVSQGIEYLKNKQFDHLSFECDVAELAYLQSDVDPFRLGQNVTVYSVPHNIIDKELAISKLSYDISKGSKKITVGTPAKQDISQITGTGGGGSSGNVISGGGGSGGGGGGGGSDVSVNPIITTGEDIATITVNGRIYYLKFDITTNGYNQTQIDGFLDTKADKSTTYTKTDVDTILSTTIYTKTEVDTALDLKADKATTYTKTEMDAALDLKANQATTYTKTETNNIVTNYVDDVPSNPAYNNLGALKIGNDIFNIPGVQAIKLTQDEYNELTDEEKHDLSKVYYITDGDAGIFADVAKIFEGHLVSSTGTIDYSIDGYDCLLVCGYADYTSALSYGEWISLTIYKDDYYNDTGHMLVGSGTDNITFEFTDDTTVTVLSQSGTTIEKIYGVKLKPIEEPTDVTVIPTYTHGVKIADIFIGNELKTLYAPAAGQMGNYANSTSGFSNSNFGTAPPVSTSTPVMSSSNIGVTVSSEEVT